MTSIPASRSARASTFAPRSCPSSPGFATRTRIFRSATRVRAGTARNTFRRARARLSHRANAYKERIPPRTLPEGRFLDVRDYAKLDPLRHERTGVPEVILAEGKLDDHLAGAARAMLAKSGRALVSRL